MVKVIASKPEETTKSKRLSIQRTRSFKNYTLAAAAAADPTKSIANMVERFVQSISQINDSGSFDTSLEVKNISSTPQRLRHRCVTELDRESLMRFVRDFEYRHGSLSPCGARSTSNSAKSTPKSSPYLCRKAKSIYQNALLGRSYSSRSASASPKLHDEATNTDSLPDIYEDAHTKKSAAAAAMSSDILMPPPTTATDCYLKRTQPERSSYRSAAKVLQFFSAKKKSKQLKPPVAAASISSCSSSATASPILMRAATAHQNDDCQPLPTSDLEDDYVDDEDVEHGDYDEYDDGISSAGSNFTQSSSRTTISTSTTTSRNCSPDSSFEMHAALVPTFKVTPPSQFCKSSKNAAYEFARFLRGSFHAKRASITTLRRSISDPDRFKNVDFTKPQTPPASKKCSSSSSNNNNNNNNSRYCCSNSSSTNCNVKKSTAPSASTAAVLADATNVKCSDVIRNRAIPANVSPFRRAWGQSSFRTPRTDKHSHNNNSHHSSSNNNHPSSPLVRRAASMTASDNDVYIKSMHGGGGSGASYIDELKQTHSQQQIASVGTTTTTTTTSTTAKMLPQIKVEQTQITTDGPTGVTAWGTSFERLLQDAAGLHTFAEFLKKEFSAENIYFWTACERFRHMDCNAERVAQAMAIFSKHLANGAYEPVNVDSQARNLTEEKLQSAERDIFAHAQKQIFNLMKFDSYQRFIRSDLYKSCVEAEEKRQPLPYSGDDLDELLKTHLHQRQGGSISNSSSNSNLSKLKKSASNAEDRCRKSLLPWHRKTSNSKSRERSETCENDSNKLTPFSSKLPLLSGSSLKIASTHNSASDLHSSRSSLSSFDALPSAFTTQACSSSNNQIAETSCSLCRVILSDGATTIVQTRHGETVGQLVERLLEKRGLCYQYYDVVANGSTKSIDLQSSAQALAGKEVLIEQRVAFKLDLPDPKVISVKSKPKKQLHEVIRPILHKYNYVMESVQVLMRDTHAQLDLSLPVTVADGQRLQIVLIKPPLPTIGTSMGADFHNGGGGGGVTTKFMKSAIPKSVTFPNSSSSSNSGNTMKQTAGMGGCGSGGVNATSRNGMMLPPATNNTSQNTLDEITNKVFNELMQGKVDAQASGEKYLPKTSDLCSLKSDDCASETSSIFDRMRRRDTNIPGFKLKYKKKSTSSQQSELDGTANQNSNSNTNTNNNNNIMNTTITNTALDIKKPIIAKLKAGVKLQVTERVAENQDELLEGLKRAQLARLEDQRGTEINFELPDFLKNKENLSAAASKLRKVRANLSPINKICTTNATPTTTVTTVTAVIDEPTSPLGERPQPAPRLSITNKNKINAVSPMKIDVDENGSVEQASQADTSNSSLEADYGAGCKGPPPLPPKPKVLPIKPSNWGVVPTTATPTTPPAITTSANNKNYTITTTMSLAASNNDTLSHSHSNSNKILTNEQSSVISRNKTHLSPMEQQQTTTRCAYLEEPSSSFV